MLAAREQRFRLRIAFGVRRRRQGDTQWRAGVSLIAFDKPELLQRVPSIGQFIAANREAMTACREAAAKAGKDQRRAITAPVPAQ